MIDLYLRAADRASIDAALGAAGLIDGEGEPLSSLVCIDRIGPIVRVTGYVDGDPVTETIEGYHVNLRLIADPTPEQLGDLDGVTIEEPAAPFRVWA